MKKLLVLLLVFCLMFTACGDSVNSDSTSEQQQSSETVQTDNSKPEEKEFTIEEISTPEELLQLSREYGTKPIDYTTVKYILTGDIDMSGITGYIPLGNTDIPFISSFDGMGYTVKNLTIDYNGDAYGKNGNKAAGLFGVVRDAHIKNLNIENIYIDGIGKNAYYNSVSGGLAGVFSGTAENCHVTGQISAIETSGGFVGRLNGPTIINNCTADADIKGSWYIGGFIGYADGTEQSLKIKDCASFGSVTAFIPSVYLEDICDVGGFGGLVSQGLIENCHSRTKMIIKDTAISVGAFLAHTHTADIENCTYDTTYTGNWDCIHWINFKRCNGDYEPYSFTEDRTKTVLDYKTSISGVDKNDVQAISTDGRYIIYKSNSTVAGDGGMLEYTLRDTATGKEKLLGNMRLSRNLDTGFFSNGDVYMMNEYDGIKIYSTDIQDTAPIFDSRINLPCGEDVDGKGTDRYLFAIRRDPQTMDYIILYTEFVRGDKQPSDFNYIAGKLDKNGSLVYSKQLPHKVDWSDQLGFLKLNMYKSAENEIEFYTIYKEKEISKGRFDFATESYTEL